MTSSSSEPSPVDFGSPKRRWTEEPSKWSSRDASSSRTSTAKSSEETNDISTDFTEDNEDLENEGKFGDVSEVEAPKQKIFASPVRNSPASFAAGRALNPNFTGPPSPLRPTMTGTRYGAALTSNFTGTPSLNGPLSPTRNLPRPGSPTKLVNPLSPLATGGGWSPRGSPVIGGGTPRCARCERPVYFAEQVKASGKIFHKPCLRCTDCNASLDSNRLAEKDGRVVCRSCYSKFYGPRGSGYALIGKAGS